MTTLFDHAAIQDEWRTTPSDLAGWAMRATAMLILAKRYHDALTAIADRDFGGYSLSVDEEEMRDDALRGLGRKE